MEASINLHDALEAALRAAVPLTEDSALQIAHGLLPPTEKLQFEEWFKVNGALLVRRLNG
jgi:hypothetical protein